ncbi:MAG TPA: Ldh family oxidoreductase [Candidatus Limnocylindrales bacterium]|nr:Ldh family oxidoreductase [Candidatus Limnocylindrales bacterium]
MEEVRVEWKALQEFTAKVFEGLGMPPQDAAKEAEVLVWANLRGVDSHGVQRIEEYSKRVDAGIMNPRPHIQILKETSATILIEADRAFGPVVTTFAMEKVIDKALEVGIGWGLIRNTTHQGAMAYYTQMAAARGMAGIAVVCSPPNMAPPGARAAGVHNSPIAIAVPGKNYKFLSLDMATSVAAGGKLHVAIDKGTSIPPEWALDKDGRPTTDPKKAVFLQPAAGYKGYGLALMFECLSSLMVGNPLITSTLLNQNPVAPGTQNSFVGAIHIGNFTDLEQYKENVDRLVTALKGLPKVEGVSEIFVPGEPEERVYEDRIKNGIPLPIGTIEKLRKAAERFKLKLPPGL